MKTSSAILRINFSNCDFEERKDAERPWPVELVGPMKTLPVTKELAKLVLQGHKTSLITPRDG